jgi:diadenosine tetraphosphate (Ap4A) HIT family hydrolase
MSYKLPPLPDEIRPIIPMPIKKVKTFDDVLDEMEEALAGLKEEVARLQSALEAQFEREMNEVARRCGDV